MDKLLLWGLCVLAITAIMDGAPNGEYRDGGLHPVASFFQRLRKVREQATEVKSDGDSTSKPGEEVTSKPPSSNSNVTQTSTPPNPDNIFVTTKPPYSADVDRINNGVSTILNGVMTLDLAQILRGAFIFPKSHKVKSVANNVIDTIFGPAPNNTSAGNNNAASTRTRY